MGPLFYFEVIRMARRGRTTFLRCVYALALLAVLYFAFCAHFPNYDLLTKPFSSEFELPMREMAVLAEGFVSAILFIQTLAILVLTPALVAGAIAEEKERGTLELLFTTHLRDREIVFGKLAARLVHAGGILLVGLPILALTQLWGGVDIHGLLAAFVVAGFNLLSVGSISILCSASSRTSLGALVGSYSLVALLTIVFLCVPYSPLGTSFGLSSSTLISGPGITSLAICLIFNGLVALIAIGLAVSNLRLELPPPGKGTDESPGTAALTVAAIIAFGESRPGELRGSPSEPLRSLPPIGEWPLLWKEISRVPLFSGIAVESKKGEPLPAYVLLTMLVLTVLVGRLVLYCIGESRAPIYSLFSGISMLALFVLGPWWFIDVAFRAASSVSRERDQKTLDTLLLLPVSRSTLLGAKWLGSILASRPLGYILIFAGAFCVGAGELGLPEAFLLTATLAAQLALLASVGIWLSLVCSTTLWARVRMAMLLLVFLCAARTGLQFDQEAQHALQDESSNVTVKVPGLTRALFYKLGLNPLGAWWFLITSRSELADVPPGDWHFTLRLKVIACGAVVYGLAAGAIWLDACRRFRREQTV